MMEFALCIALYAALFTIVFLAATPVYVAAKYTLWLSRRFARWQPVQPLLLACQWLGILAPAGVTTYVLCQVFIGEWDYKQLCLYAVIAMFGLPWTLGAPMGLYARNKAMN